MIFTSSSSPNTILLISIMIFNCEESTEYLNDITICRISLHIGKFMLDIVQRRMLFSRGRGRLWGRNLTKSFFAYSQNIYTPENFIVPFFFSQKSKFCIVSPLLASHTDVLTGSSRNLSLRTFAWEASPLPNAKWKISNIWWLVSPTTTVWLKTVVKWPRLLRFSSKMTLVYARITEY